MWATVSDLEVRWRPLTVAERSTATALIGDAEDMLVSLGVPDDPEWERSGVARAVVCSMVRRAMQATGALAGVSTASQSASPYSASLTFANPTGSLYLESQEKRALGITSMRMGSIMPEVGWPHDRR